MEENNMTCKKYKLDVTLTLQNILDIQKEHNKLCECHACRIADRIISVKGE